MALESGAKRRATPELAATRWAAYVALVLSIVPVVSVAAYVLSPPPAESQRWAIASKR
jgi:hypothetical protein